VLELELVDDPFNPISTVESEPYTPDERIGIHEDAGFGDGVVDPTEEELIESTVSIVKPLRTLARIKERQRRKGRKPNNRGLGETDVVGLLGQINDQMGKAEDLETFLKVRLPSFLFPLPSSLFSSPHCAPLTRSYRRLLPAFSARCALFLPFSHIAFLTFLSFQLTEFDRVMIYQFDESWNGRVVAEQVDYSRTKDLFRGLNFPASDIPAQARQLYRINKVRLLYDRDQPTARLCCRSIGEVNTPLDMTHCHLRAMSPIHIKVRLPPLPLLLILTTSAHSTWATWACAPLCPSRSPLSVTSGACT
jgi:hypothetical protein